MSAYVEISQLVKSYPKPGGGEAVIPSATGFYREYQGETLWFQSEADWQAFVRGEH